MASAFGLLVLWVFSLVMFILVIARGMRVGMRWSRKVERRERESAGTPYRPGESVFNYKPEKRAQYKTPKSFKSGSWPAFGIVYQLHYVVNPVSIAEAHLKRKWKQLDPGNPTTQGLTVRARATRKATPAGWLFISK